MEIERGKTYICKKSLYSISFNHMAFLAGKEYKAEKDNSLYGDDNISYALPEHWRLENWFEQKGK